MWLDSNVKLQVVLGGAVTTSELEWAVDYTTTDDTGSDVGPLAARGTTSGTTGVDVVAAPTNPNIVGVNHLSVFNADTVAATVTIRLNESGTFTRRAKVTLQTGETLYYDRERGWYCFDSNGNTK